MRLLARIQSVRDVRHQDGESIPRVVFWMPGSEIAEALTTVAHYVGKPVRMLVTGTTNGEIVVFVRSAVFGADREGLLTVDVEQPFTCTVGQEVELSFSGGG